MYGYKLTYKPNTNTFTIFFLLLRMYKYKEIQISTHTSEATTTSMNLIFIEDIKLLMEVNNNYLPPSIIIAGSNKIFLHRNKTYR
jgi:hypothetical protein